MIIVTGSGSGMGKCIAQRLHSNGEKVLGISLYKPQYDPEFDTILADVRDIKSLYSISKDILENGEEVTALINCAGIYEPTPAGFFFEDKAYNVINTNLNGVFNSCQAFLSNMNPEVHTSIINISSLAAHMANEATMYSASKAGVESFTKGFAKQISNTKIRANCIAPGPIITDLTRRHLLTGDQSAVKNQIIERLFDLDDVANLVELLMDSRSDSLTGQVLHIGGI
jgi:3-oxoacyl-[acyl-carrier protein] reductase